MINRLFCLLVILSMFGCGGGSASSDAELEIPDSIKNPTQGKMLELGQDVLEDLVQNVSSPVEMAALIKKVGVPFSKEYLSDPDLVDKYNVTYSRALNLGVYACDLGYLNMYDKTSLILSHISAIKKLTEQLKIGQFFDFSTLKRLASNDENLDSLMYISTSCFNKMDRYLRENNRSNASTLMVTGVWVEGLFLATQVAKNTDSKEIQERIGEQKISLNDLLIILKVYKNDNNFAELVSDFEQLKSVFEPIKISVEKGEPSMEEVDGKLIIVQNDKQVIDMPDGQLQKITEVTEAIRNKIIGM